MSAPLLMLKELGTIHTGSTPKTNDESLFGGDVPFVTPGDLDAVSPIQSTPRTLTEAGVKTADLLPAESVLVCCIGSLGKIGFAGRPVVTNQQINAVVFNPAKVHARYGFFACRMLKPQLELMAPATTVPIVNKSRFSELRIPVPPLEEQRRIAAILDQAETLRTQRRQALAHLDTLTQSLFLDMFGDPARNTLGLPMQALGDLGDWHSGGTPPRGSGHYFEGDIPWFSSGELESMYVSDSSEHISESAVRETSAKLVPAGALMLGMYDTAALKSSIAMNACSCNQAIAFASIRSDRALTEYVYFAVQVGREDFRRLQRGVRQKNLNLSMVREIRIPAPTLALQQTFATRIQAIEALKATHRTALAQLDALFASLQQRAFAGEL